MSGMDLDTDMLDPEEAFQVTLEPEPNQRSLHDFFAGDPLNASKQQSMYDFFIQPHSDSRRAPESTETKRSTLQLTDQTTPDVFNI